MVHPACVLFLLLGLAAQDPEPTTFALKTKATLTGHVQAVEGERAVLTVLMMGGSATIRRPLSEFTPESEFLIRTTATPPMTFAEHMAMAQTAYRLELLPQAGVHAGLARKLAEADASGAQRKTLDAWAGGALGSLFRRALQRQDMVDARHYLRLIATRVPEEFSDDQMGKMFDQLADAEVKERTVLRATVAVKEAAARHLELDKAWAPILAHLQQADELVKAGLRNSRSTSQATISFERAVERYMTTGKDLQKVIKEQGNDPVAQEEAADLVQRVKDSAVQAAMHAGNALTLQGDYRSAMEWANKGLLIDPASPDAKALIRTIQLAQASGGAWGRGWGQ